MASRLAVKGTSNDGHQDPLVNMVLRRYCVNTPGVARALYELGRMRTFGVDITEDIAIRCVEQHIQESANQRPLPKPTPPLVYYVRTRGFVKIGFTRDYRRRMNDLLPELVLATEPGGRKLEQARHRQFAHLLAMRSEYFREAPDLLAHIRQTRQIHGNPEALPGVPVWEVS
jgi:hypothetical protein